MSPTPVLKRSGGKDFAHPGQMIWVIIFGTFMLLLAVFLVVQQTVNQARELAFSKALEVNNKIVLSDEVRIRSLLSSLDKVLLVLRRDFADNPNLSDLAIMLRLDELQIDSELNPQVSFADARGDVLLSSARENHDDKRVVNVANRAYFRAQQSDQRDMLGMGAPIVSRVSGKWVVPLTRRISRSDGSFGGVICMTVDPVFFTADAFDSTPAGGDASRAIVGMDGTIRLRLVSGKLSFAGDVQNSQVFNEIAKSKVGSYTAISATDGVNRAVSYRVLDPYALIILTGSSIASIEDSYRDKVRRHIIESSLFGLLIVLLSSVLIFGVVRQKKLFESQQTFSQLIELLPQQVSRLDAHGNIIWVNDRTVEYVGPGADEQSRGFEWVQGAVHPQDRARVKDFVLAALQLRPHAQSCEFRMRRGDAAYHWFISQITPVLEQDGKGVSFLQTCTDIHDRRMADERARVTQKLVSIGQLTGGMAHDFNNLLAIILGNLDLLGPNLKNEVDVKRIGVAVSAAERGVGLVKSMLALASKQPLLPTRIDLWPLIERVAPLLHHALSQRVNFSMKPPEASVHVNVDEAGLEAVLLNLIVNARDAMPRGGDLTLSLEASQGMARITIQDTGTGMPEAVLKRATEAFFTTKELGHGTGLGLSMVAEFAKQSGGTIKIESEEGKGTKVEICLPLSVAARVPDISEANGFSDSHTWVAS